MEQGEGERASHEGEGPGRRGGAGLGRHGSSMVEATGQWFGHGEVGSHGGSTLRGDARWRRG